MLMRKLFFAMFFLIATMAMGMMALGVGIEADVPDSIPEVSEKQAVMNWAAEQGKILFLYDAPGAEGYALCMGTERLVGLPAQNRQSVKLTSNEAVNLSLCKQDSNNPSVYSKIRDISGTSPGDFLIWDTDGALNWNRYTN